MNELNVLTRIYGRLHNYDGIPYWVLTPIRRIVRGIANRRLPRYLSRIQTSRMDLGKGVIVSFTSFPARINNVWGVVETLKNQSVKPERIILWLSKDQFPNHEDIPTSLWESEDELFEIRLVEGDIRSHKKYFYAIQEFPQKSIVTCDDDIYYHPDMLKSLVETALIYPHCIIANISAHIQFDRNGEILPYKKWTEILTPLASDNIVQIGAGGVLYPPGSLHSLVLRSDIFVDIAPLADDLWLNMMARLKKTPVLQSNRIRLPLSIQSYAPQLQSQNNGPENLNDVQIQKMRKWLRNEGYSDVYASDYKIDKPEGGGNLIVSLTSFPGRINSVWQVIVCMLNQTLLPKAIILWLSKEQFADECSIPESLKRLESDLFRIRMVEGDIRSHKKYLYACREYPDSCILLVDDDLYYPTDMVGKMMREYQATGHMVSMYASHIQYNNDLSIAPYSTWKDEFQASSSDDLFFGTGGGFLFKPSEMFDDIKDIDLALRLCPTADDIWLNAMARINNKKVSKLKSGIILPIADIDNNENLKTTNVDGGANDYQLKAVNDYYIEKLGKRVF